MRRAAEVMRYGGGILAEYNEDLIIDALIKDGYPEIEGEAGLQTLIALIEGFVGLGGFFVQPDVADAAVLRDAQCHPENYRGLSVRVSGWNARFVTLDKEWQNMVIDQIENSTHL